MTRRALLALCALCAIGANTPPDTGEGDVG